MYKWKKEKREKGLAEADMDKTMIVWQQELNAQKNKKKTTETIRREVVTTVTVEEIEGTGVIIAVVVVAEEGEEVDRMIDHENVMTRNTRESVQKDNKTLMMKMMFGQSVNTSHLNTK